MTVAGRTTLDERRPAGRGEPMAPPPAAARRLRVPAPLLLCGPFVLLFVAFYVLPILWSLRTSLYADRLIGGESFVGFDWYEQAVGDESFRTGFRNVGLLSLVQVPLMLALATVLALALDGVALRARTLFRLGIFVPYAVPTVIAALMWGFMYDPELGPLGQIADGVGVGSPEFLSSAWMLPSVGNILTWAGTGVAMIILYTTLKTIPVELEEAAAIDGATPRDIVRTIKVPLLRPTLTLLALLGVIVTLQLFNEPAVLRQLAPQVIGNDFTPNLYAYSLAFQANDPNYAAALAFLLAGIIMLVSYGAVWIARVRGRA